LVPSPHSGTEVTDTAVDSNKPMVSISRSNIDPSLPRDNIKI
jgi:hypothetical protein